MTLWKWSQTASVNGNADSTCPFPEGMAPSALNDGTRGMMAAVAKWRDDISGVLVSAGTSAAYTLSTNQILQNPPTDGQMIAFTPHVTNTGSQITVDGSLATIQTQIGALVPAGTLIATTPYRVKYSAAANAWVLEGFYGNPFNIPIGGMMPYIAGSAPNGNFIIPVGQGLSRSVYATLFAMVGTTYGAGDGSTTFNVIDMRGNTPVAQDAGAGRVPGLNVGTYTGQSAIVLGLTHLPASPVAVGGATSGYNPTIGGGQAYGVPVGTAGPAAFSATGGNQLYQANAFGAIAGFSSLSVSGNTANLGNSTAFTNVQPSVGVNYILRII